jgi:hypothetical protein
MAGRPASLTRQLLRRLHIDNIREIVDFYDLSRAKSAEDMILQIVRRVGTELDDLVSAEGPYSADQWNEIAEDLGGQARKSFEGIRAELTHRLDPVVDEFDMNESVADIREDGAAIRRLARVLRIDREELEERLEDTHGRTLLGRFIADLRENPRSELRDDVEDNPEDEEDQQTARGPETIEALRGLLDGALVVHDAGSGWPATATLTVGQHKVELDLYSRAVGGSARNNPLERRFQNPDGKVAIRRPHDRYALLLGLWQEQGENRSVIVAFDAYRRIGKNTRFSLFMPLALLEQAADTGYATHVTTSNETLFAFRPEKAATYLEAFFREAPWGDLGPTTQSTAVRPAIAAERGLTEVARDNISIRPRVGMYAAFARLNYKPWFALAEFVDNSIQSFLAQRERLIAAGYDGALIVDINLDDDELSIADRAAGIALADFPRAFSPAAPPDDTSGLSEFGLGMKAAACWFSRNWSVRTSALGESLERTVTFDVASITRDGVETLPIESRPTRPEDHFTVVTLRKLRVRLRGGTLAKIKTHLSSIYRVLIADGLVKLRLTSANRSDELKHEQPTLLEAPHYRTPSARSLLWRREINVELHDRRVTGWAGVMKEGSFVHAGFSVFRRNRLIEGSVGETYKPRQIFGAPNSFASQRIVGELFVHGFDVTHTKDGIQWGDLEDEVIEAIRAQMETEELPLLDQANGYRARRQASALPANFGADAMQATRTSLATSAASHVLDEQVSAPAPEVATAADSRPPESVLQHCELHILIPHRNRSWNVRLQLVRDPGMEWYSLSRGEGAEADKIAITVNLDHAFSLAFVNDNERALEPLLRVVTALCLAECVAREQGVRNAGAVRRAANDLLREVLSDVPIQRERAR